MKEKKFLYEVINIGDDGKCLFRSIADQIERNQERHQVYRKMIISEIKSN